MKEGAVWFGWGHKYWAGGNQKEKNELLEGDQIEWSKLTRRREAGMSGELQQAVLGTDFKWEGKGGSQNWKEGLGGWGETGTKFGNRGEGE